MKAVAWIALGLALAGSLVAVGAYARVRSAPPAPPAASGEVESLRARVGRLETELARSREQAARLESELKSSEAPLPAPPAPAAGSGELSELRRRVEVLERQVAAGRAGPGETGRGGRSNPAVVESLKRRLNDAARKEADRATALTLLRAQGAHGADDVVDAALALLAQATEARTRALILRNLHGANNPKMVPSLLTYLKGDADEEVRDEAAETLGDYAGQPEVKEALEQAAANDPSDKVRRQARASLGSRK